jgi:methionyl-tRNA formyltransferase
MDTGPIYTTAPFDVSPTINTPELLDGLALLGVKAVLQTISLIESGVNPTVQASEGITRANKLTSEEAQIDWSQSTSTIVNKIRAFYPNPGAWTTFRDVKIKLNSATISELKLKPGEIAQQGKAILVGTSDGAIELITVNPAGKSAMSAQDWANGQHLIPNEKFEIFNG